VISLRNHTTIRVDPSARYGTVEFLSRLGSAAAGAVQPLSAALDDDPQLRTHVAVALAGLRDPRAIPVRIALLDEFRRLRDNPFAGFHALVVSGTLRDSRFILEGLLVQPRTGFPRVMLARAVAGILVEPRLAQVFPGARRNATAPMSPPRLDPVAPGSIR
jgi:hypothetical protein